MNQTINRDSKGRFAKKEARPFKVGDVVRISKKHDFKKYPHDPGIGKIRSIREAREIIHGEYVVDWNSGEWNTYWGYELELVPNAPKQKRVEKKPDGRPFKVGDRVTGKSNIGTTETGIITEDDGKPLHPYNQHYKVNGVWMYTDTLKLAPKEHGKDKKKPKVFTIQPESEAIFVALAKAMGYKVEKA